MRKMDWPTTLFPLPDSPTIPRVFPGSKEKLMSSTALTVPSSSMKWTFKFSTTRAGVIQITSNRGLPRL